jgi:predicted branched-subunit amino acid permease
MDSGRPTGADGSDVVTIEPRLTTSAVGPGPDVASAVAAHDRSDRRRLAFEGARDMAPMTLGVIPFGFAIGAMISSSSIGLAPGIASAPLVLAGAAQLAVLQMLEAGANPVVIVVSALVINLRILLYGASLAPWFRGARLRTKLLVAEVVIDQTHFVCVPRFERGDLSLDRRVTYYSGAGLSLAGGFVASQVIAVLLGASLPDAARLDMAAPLALVGLLAKSTIDVPRSLAAGAAVVLAALAVAMPFHLSVLVATLAAIAVGVTAQVRSERKLVPA